ncbi:MAG TPA: DNA internalization-related competence protein ComEC/Rec2 [Gammaproteobacteria bacterium]|nr:DNA internalization-related competence protein ComEC/Rec2 [Gammaproteobacteria bacterium]
MHVFRELYSLPAATLCFLSGNLAFQQLPALPPVAWCWLLPVALWVTWRCPLWRPAAFFTMGFLWPLLVASPVLSQQFPVAWVGHDLVVEGRIASLPEKDGRRERFYFDVLQWENATLASSGPKRLLLSWYQGAPPLVAGQRWRLTVRLKPPHGFMNPGGYDYEKRLFRQRVRATGYVRNRGERRLLEDAPPGLDRMRQALTERIRQILGDSEMAGLIRALVVGDRQAVSSGQWAVLTRTGTNHLLAISGLHIGLVSGLAFFLARRLWVRIPRAVLYLPAPAAGAGAGLLAAAAYAALAGFTLPTQRALLMVAVVMSAVMLRRQSQSVHTFMLALLAVLLFDPLATLDEGFWLSFAAVAFILYALLGRRRSDSHWRSWGRVQWSLAVGLLPLMLILFQRSSLVAPLANLVAVPWVGFVVVPLALAGAALLVSLPGVGAILLHGAGLALAGLWYGLEALAALPWAEWTQSAPPAWALAAAVLGAVMLLAPAGIPGRWVGAVLLLPLALVTPPRPGYGEAWFTLLDVGQGLAAVVRTTDHALLFDTGPRFGPQFDAGRAVVVPFLRHEGIRRLDLLVLSHGDMDHRGGLSSIVSELPVARALSSAPRAVEQHLSQVAPCQAGQRWQWDGVEFEMIYPFDAISSGNDSSCVLRVTAAGGADALLTGDIERKAEQSLLKAGGMLAAKLLVAPHHGSNTSSTMAFVRAVAPRYVLFPVGWHNRYGFPKPEVMARYAAVGAVGLSTAALGAIRFRLRAQSPTAPEPYRRQARRYWHSPCEC